MFGTRKRTGDSIVAVVDIGSGSAGVAIMKTGGPPHVLALAREILPLEDRKETALKTGVVQALSTAGNKALAEFAATTKGKRVSSCYCVVGAPWSKSFACEASQRFEHPAIITDATIDELAKKALANQKEIDKNDLLEATVVRVLLNGYPTSEPKGKRAIELHLHTLASNCDAGIRSGVQETLAKLFPGAPLTMRSNTRAVLSVSEDSGRDRLIVETSTETSDVVVVRKGVFTERAALALGSRQLAETFARGKPAEETFTLLEMLEKDQCETTSCEDLKTSIAKAEPELAKQFGEAFTKLSGERKLPEHLVTIAPPHLNAWLQQFFSRLDFTQFTVTARPFSASKLLPETLTAASDNPRLLADTGLALACTLVNTDFSS